MNPNARRNGILATTALAALVVYILACTSFSPDDSKVLYPAFDAKSGTLGISVYDRKTGVSDLVFAPTFFDTLDEAQPELRPLRSQWLRMAGAFSWRGRARPGTVTPRGSILPWSRSGSGGDPILLRAGDQRGGQQTRRAAGAGGSRLFVVAASNRVVRLDLVTGELKSHLGEGEVGLVPSPRGTRSFMSANPR